jgi:hypothetical protein
MRVDQLIRMWEESHESLHGRPWLRYEFKLRKETLEILRYADQDITRCVARKKLLTDILDLLKSTSTPLPSYSPALKPKDHDPALPAPEPKQLETSDEEWMEWNRQKTSTRLSPEEIAKLYNKESN